MARDLAYYRQVDSAFGVGSLLVGHPLYGDAVVGNLTENRLYAQPFPTGPAARTIGAIGFVTALSPASGSVARLGVYGRRSETDILPGPLLLDAGSVNISGNGYMHNSCMLVTSANDLIWLVMNTSSHDVDGVGPAVGEVADTFGVAAGNDNFAHAVFAPSSFMNGLPSTFPASFTTTDGFWAVLVRYSG